MRLPVRLGRELKRRLVRLRDGARRVGRAAHHVHLARRDPGQELRLNALVPDFPERAAVDGVVEVILVRLVEGVEHLGQRGVGGLVRAPDVRDAGDLAALDLDGHGDVVRGEVVVLGVGAERETGVAAVLVAGRAVVGVGARVVLARVVLARVVLAGIVLAGIILAVRLAGIVLARVLIGSRVALAGVSLVRVTLSGIALIRRLVLLALVRVRLLVGLLGKLKRRLVRLRDGTRRVGRAAHHVHLARRDAGQELRLHANVPGLLYRAPVDGVVEIRLVGLVEGVKDVSQRRVRGAVRPPDLRDTGDLAALHLDGHGDVIGVEVLVLSVGAQREAGVVAVLIARSAAGTISPAVGVLAGIRVVRLSVRLAVRFAGVVLLALGARPVAGVRHGRLRPRGRGGFLQRLLDGGDDALRRVRRARDGVHVGGLRSHNGPGDLRPGPKELRVVLVAHQVDGRDLSAPDRHANRDRPVIPLGGALVRTVREAVRRRYRGLDGGHRLPAVHGRAGGLGERLGVLPGGLEQRVLDGGKKAARGIRGAGDRVDVERLLRDDRVHEAADLAEVRLVVAARDDLDGNDLAALDGDLHGDGAREAGARPGIGAVLDVGQVDAEVRLGGEPGGLRLLGVGGVDLLELGRRRDLLGGLSDGRGRVR